MKKHLLTLIIAISLCASARSQSLYNTYWSMYDPGNVFFAYFHFTNDTLFFSVDNVTYFEVSYFAVNGDTMTVADFNGGTGCAVTDTGKYTFTIQNDTLQFTMINDPCTARASVLDPYYGVAFQTAIETHNTSSTVKLFPNPSPDGIFNLVLWGNKEGFDKLSVSTIEGKIILEETIRDHSNIEQIISLTKFPSGIYFLTLYSKNEKKVMKLCKLRVLAFDC